MLSTRDPIYILISSFPYFLFSHSYAKKKRNIFSHFIQIKKFKLIFQLVSETFVLEIFPEMSEFLLRYGHQRIKTHAPSKFEVNFPEIRPLQISQNIIPQRKFCHHWDTGLATGLLRESACFVSPERPFHNFAPLKEKNFGHLLMFSMVESSKSWFCAGYERSSVTSLWKSYINILEPTN